MSNSTKGILWSIKREDTKDTLHFERVFKKYLKQKKSDKNLHSYSELFVTKIKFFARH